MTRTRVVAAAALLFTYVFFLEYLPPFRKVHIPYDLDGFHYPLADYAFQRVREGRLPEWDPTIYCGMSFVANIQAALFYPPTWLLLLANAGRRTLSYQSLETFQLAHVWLGFLLCFLWLRGKRLTGLASILGAGVFAFSGHMLLQLQHQGLVTAHAWMPLGLWGIDEAAEQRRWRPLWKLVVASAMCFLAGYPPTWFTYAVCVVAYAAWRRKIAMGAVAALGFSLVLAAVQLAPSWEASRLMWHEPRYGAGIRDPEFFLAYFLPNYADFGLHVDPEKRGEYLYLGAPAFLGLAYLVRRSKRRELIPSAAMLGASLTGLTNPLNLVGTIVVHSSGLLDQLCRDFYFLAGVSLALAPLAAYGLDEWLTRPRRQAPRWLALLAIALLAAWAGRELALWFPIGSDLPAGWKSGVEAGITLALFALATFLLPGQKGALRVCLAGAVLLGVAVDYKVSGTSKRINAAQGMPFTFRTDAYPAMNAQDFHELRTHPLDRIALDETGPFPQFLRHPRFTTPQGFDPFLTAQYKALMEKIGHFRTDRFVDLDPANYDALRLLGVRYFITSERTASYRQMLADPNFRLLARDSYFKVFEFGKARPPYGWEGDTGAVQVLEWAPETRRFALRSDTGGRFTLAEEFWPGWRATVDGIAVPIERWSQAFQAIRVPAGAHQVEFHFRSPGLRVGAGISLLTLIGLIVMVYFEPARRAAANKAARRSTVCP